MTDFDLLQQRLNLANALKERPDAFARRTKIAAALQKPPGLINADDENLYDVDSTMRALDGRPVLLKTIRDNSAFAKLAHDDFERLANIEHLATLKQERLRREREANRPWFMHGALDEAWANIRKIPKAAWADANDKEVEDLRYTLQELEKAGTLTEEGRARIEADIKIHENQRDAAFDEIADINRSIADNSPEDLNIWQKMGRGAVTSLPQMAAAAGITMVSRNPTLGALAMGYGVKETSTAEARIAGLDYDAAQRKGMIDGAAEAAFEILPLGKMMGLYGRGAAQEGRATLKELGKTVASEVAGENATQLIQDANNLWHGLDPVWQKAIAEHGLFSPESLKIQGERQLIASGAAALTSGTLGAPALIANMRRSQEQDITNLTAMTDAARASKLHQRAPDVFRGLAEQIEENADIQHYYVDGNALHQSGLVAALEEALPDRVGEIRQSLATGGSVQIPAADILTKIAPDKGLEDAITPHLRTADGLSLHELETTGQAELEGAITENVARAAEADARQQETDAIRDDFAAQITATGRMTRDAALQNAALPAAFYQNIAQRLGISVSEAYEKYKLKVVGEPLVGLNQPMTQGFQWEFGQRRGLFGIADIPVTEISGKELGQDERAIRTNLNEHLKAYAEGGLTNRDTGWDLRISSEDRKKLAKWFGATLPSLQSQAALEEIVENAVLAESHPDSRHENGDVIGIHRLYAPVSIDGKLHRAKLTVRDYQSKSTGDKTRLRRLEAIEIENAPMGTLPMPEANLQTTAQPTSGRLSLSVRELLRDSKRDDGTAWDFTDNTLHQNADAGSKRGAFDPDTNTIALLEKADLSTFIHELGHFYFETLTRIANDLRARDNAAGGGTLTEGEIRLLKDADTLLGKAELTLDDWNQMTLKERRGHHENIAKQFEAYLMTGKAPDVELQGIFSRARAWLFAVYRNWRGLGVTLDDDVRQVFDRMLASDEAIQIAEQNRSMMPLFSTPEAGMTAEQFADYQRQFQGASDAALDEMSLRMLADAKAIGRLKHKALKAKDKEATILRGETEIEARRAIMAQPVYRVWQMLTEDEKSDNPAFRLDPQALEAMDYSAEQIKTLGRKVRKSNSIHPDLLAELVMDADGNPVYDSGDALVQALLAAPEPKAAVRELTDRIMLERHGELATPEAINDAAELAIHNDRRLRVLATEYNALAKAAGSPRLVQSAARQLAAQAIGQKRIRDLSPAQYTRMETRAAKAALAAMKKGDIATAAAEKHNQALQASLAREALDAKVEVKKMINYLRRAAHLNPKEVAIEEREQIEALLERFDLRDQSGRAIDRKQSLAEWVQAQREQGIEPDIAPEMLDELKRQPWQTLTVEEFRGLVDTIRQIEHRGKEKNRLLLEQKQQDLNVAKEEISESVKAARNGKIVDNSTPATWLGQRMAALRRFGWMHTKAPTVFYILDGGKRNGPMWRYFGKLANERANFEAAERARLSEALMKISTPLFKRKGLYKRSIRSDIPDRNGQPRVFTPMQVFTVALNMGNAGNLQRLLDGNHWTRDQVERLTANLTGDEWRAVQNIWNLFESMKEQVAAKERRVNGIEPQWVEAVPLTVTSIDGETLHLRGGYYPVKYDAGQSQQAEQFQDAEAGQVITNAAFTSATTRRSYTKARAAAVKDRPLLLDISVMYDGLNEIVHDLAWHEFLIDANRLIRSHRVDSAIRDYHGAEYVRLIKDWLQDIAAGDKIPSTYGARMVAAIRQNVSFAGLAFNVVSALKQLSGLPNSIVRVGAPDILAATLQYMRRGRAMTREAVAASAVMENRARTRFRELNEVRNSLRRQGRVKQQLYRWGYAPLLFFQQQVDVITWHGEYHKQLAAGMNEADAVALADQAVLDAQGGGELKDLSAIERDPVGKIFTVFYSYMNTVLNLGIVTVKGRASIGRKAAALLTLFTVPAIIDTLLGTMLTLGDDDDDETLGQKLVEGQIGYLMGLTVLTREASGAAKALFGVDKGSYKGPTAFRFFDDLHKAAKQIGQGEMDEAMLTSIINLSGDFGLPSAQINRSIKGIKALQEDKTDNPLALIFGYKEKK
nr:MAG TPA: crystallin beta/gamma motif-containing protein [Caudoviricetes sp.]